MNDQVLAQADPDGLQLQPEAETAAEQAEAALPDQFEFAEWRLTVKGNPETMTKLVERLERTQVGRQLEAGRRLLATHHLVGSD